MATLSTDQIAALLGPFVPSPPLPELLDRLSTYLDLLLRWNRRVNLTAIRSPEEIVQRHFGESLFTGYRLAEHLPTAAPGYLPSWQPAQTRMLDYGSGAGFPGLPIQLLLPHVQIILAESQARKVAFLREAVRTLSLQTEVWPQRVEEMPPDRTFDVVMLRAVDRMEISLPQAEARVQPGGWLAVLAGKEMEAPAGTKSIALPESEHRRLILRQKL